MPARADTCAAGCTEPWGSAIGRRSRSLRHGYGALRRPRKATHMTMTTPTTIDDLLDAGHRRIRLPEWESRAYAEVVRSDDRLIRVVTPEYHEGVYPLGVPPWSQCRNGQAWTVLIGIDEARQYTGWVAARARQRTRPRWTRPATTEERIMRAVRHMNWGDELWPWPDGPDAVSLDRVADYLEQLQGRLATVHRSP